MLPKTGRWRRALWYWSMRLVWLGSMRPNRMKRRGRLEDQNFLSAEKLYMRFKSDWLDENDHILPACIHFPDQSVNRDKCSEAYDVLLPNNESRAIDMVFWGVASVTVDDVPKSDGTNVESKAKNKAAQLRFTVEHDPLEDNYGHTELRVYKNGSRTRKSNVAELAKKAYRTKLAGKTAVVIRPAI